MIFFCEDCGKKNSLTPSQFKNGKAIFKCDVCGYKNSYSFQTSEKKKLKKIDQLIKEIHLSSDVIGSFLFHRKTGVIRNNMPNMLKESDIIILGEALLKINRIGSTRFSDINGTVLIIAGKSMIAKAIDNELTLIIAGRTFPLSKNISDRLVRLVPKTIKVDLQ